MSSTHSDTPREKVDDQAVPNAHPTQGAGPAPVPNEVPLLNVANLLTLVRLAIVPVFLVVLFIGDGTSPSWRLAATGLFALASITDHLDGQLARKNNLVTDFGKIIDPIADKALTGSALVGLSILGELPWWVTIVIAVRELGVTALRFWVIRYGVIAASRGGKIKTLVQIIAIVLFLLPLPAAVDPVQWAMMGLAVALTIGTGVDYTVRALYLRTRGRRAVGQ
jgi:CDP-diacylglycerol---glycerol-3-phosphate 3-phosphatidyltransferase